MLPTVRLVFVVHDHQPVGNFDDVFARTYADSYLPFLDVLERHPAIRIAIHTSGPLAEWLDRQRPEYLDRLAARVAAGQVEIVGGGFYEPILALLTSRDRIGQIGLYRDWLEGRLRTPVRGMWVAERVWDPGMAADIAAAGMTWTILDDTHFKAAGLRDDELDRLWLTEADGKTLAVFPVSERLRYLIPFAAPEATIDHLRFMATRRPGALAVFADDGEKFGAWPETHRTCFTEGWLERFFTLLETNADWIRMCLPAEVVADEPPAGTVWLPECSYREMTEWVLPPEPQLACIEARKAAATDPRLAGAAAFLRGGSWRNFRRRYPEANEMYARMMAVSTRLARLSAAGSAGAGPLAEAERALYRGQCNCAYWHGAFGGIYLPHLRNAVFAELIAADVAADRAEGRTAPWIETTTADFDFDGHDEIRIGSDALEAWIAPARGGILYELDLRTSRHNLLATLDRRPEAYHAQVIAGPGAARSGVTSPPAATRPRSAATPTGSPWRWPALATPGAFRFASRRRSRSPAAGRRSTSPMSSPACPPTSASTWPWSSTSRACRRTPRAGFSTTATARRSATSATRSTCPARRGWASWTAGSASTCSSSAPCLQRGARGACGRFRSVP
jgi:alpha-amylase